jgi:hypothetical protein
MLNSTLSTIGPRAAENNVGQSLGSFREVAHILTLALAADAIPSQRQDLRAFLR